MMADLGASMIKKLLFVPAALVGVVVLVYAIQNREPPQRKPPVERKVAARVILAPDVAVVPRALAYGNAQPEIVWDAVAEVGGKVIELHPELRNGAILPEGTVLLRIDPTDYEIDVARLEASLRDADAKLAELDIQERNTGELLKIEQRSHVLSEKDLARKRTLLKKGNIAQAAVDAEERALLTRQESVQLLRNTLNLIPAQRNSLQAQMAVSRSQLEKARLDVTRTTIVAPFDARVAAVHAERAQYANAGQVLAVLDSIAVSEVNAQLPIDKLMSIMPRAQFQALTAGEAMRVLREVLGLRPTVRLYAGDATIEWAGRFARISDTIDPQARTVGVIVAVDGSYQQARPGVRPPLAKNMYVEVELRGNRRERAVVVPRAALHEGFVYVLDAEDRLRKRLVKIDFHQSDFSVIAEGLEPGQRIIVSDLVPAIEGMLIAPQADDALLKRLVAQANGEGSVK